MRQRRHEIIVRFVQITLLVLLAFGLASTARASPRCVEVAGSGPDEVQDAVRRAVRRAYPDARIQAGQAERASPGEVEACDVEVRFIDEVDGVRLKVSRQGQTEFRRAAKLGPILDLGGLLGAGGGAGAAGLCAWGCAPLVSVGLFIHALLSVDEASAFSSPVTWCCGSFPRSIPVPGLAYLLCCGLPAFSGYWGGRTFLRYRDKALDQALLDALSQSFTALRVRDEGPEGAPYVGFTLDDALPFAY